MVKQADHNQEATIKDVICPKCYRYLNGCSVRDIGCDRYERRMRSYIGWCTRCNLGSEVVQFADGDRWKLHKWRYYAKLGLKNAPSTGWQIITELPDSPVVVTGPGGDYDKAYTPQTIEAVKLLLDAFKGGLKAIEHILKDAGAKF